jgi:hypothetical protein
MAQKFMEIVLIRKDGKHHELSLPDIRGAVSSDWLRALTARFFLFSPLDEICKTISLKEFNPDFIL